MSALDQLATVRRLCPQADVWQEGGRPLVFLPGLKILHAGRKVIVDALLSPQGDGSYASRLYLSQAFPSRGANWTAHVIAGRPWHAMSWNGVPSTLSWLQMLANHLRPLQ